MRGPARESKEREGHRIRFLRRHKKNKITKSKVRIKSNVHDSPHEDRTDFITSKRLAMESHICGFISLTFRTKTQMARVFLPIIFITQQVLRGLMLKEKEQKTIPDAN